jgi:NitT/TauT family transport system substrate-binding protein
MTRPGMRLVAAIAAALLGGMALPGCREPGHATRSEAAVETAPVRLGFFPNLTHAVALVGLAHGELARGVAPATIVPTPFIAGPAAMEAMFAGALDACYVGPAPAINGYLRSRGEKLVIVAGAAENGAGLVVRKDAGIAAARDLRGKKLATPQLGNTQDVALRRYLADAGLRTSDRGGDVQVLPLANADILTLMKRKQLDGAWVPEPWMSRLVHEAEGILFVDERTRWPQRRFPTTVLVLSRALVTERPQVARRLVAAHVATVRWIAGHRDEARALVDDGLARWAKKKLAPAVLAEAWEHVDITERLDEAALHKQLDDARALDFAPAEGDTTGLVDRRFLDAVTAPDRR